MRKAGILSDPITRDARRLPMRRSPTRRRVRTPLAVLSASVMATLIWIGPGATALAAPADDGGVGIRLLDVPADQQDDPRARSYLVDEVPPGGRLERRVEIANSSGVDQQVFVYAGPAEISDGVFTVDGVDAPDISSWITPAVDSVELTAGAMSDVAVTVTVPPDAPEGEYYAGIWAEVRSAGAKESVTLANRVGVRVYLTVGSGNGPPPDFTITGISAERDAAGVPVLHATVSNTGTTAVDVSGAARLVASAGGITAGPFPSGNLTLGPGQRGDLEVPTASGIADGEWSATLSLTSGLITREATATVSITGGGTAAPPAAAADPADGTTVLPVVIGGLLLAVVVILVLLLLRRRTSRRA